jgi:hypothetical protein
MVKTMATKNSNGNAAVNHRGYYSNVWANWSTKALGPQPTNDQLGTIHGLKARPGKQALANAMALRDCGVTGAQIKGAVALIDGGANPQLNKMRSLVDSGMLSWVPMPNVGAGKVYRTKLTPLGAQMVKGNAAATVHVTPTLAAKAPKPAPQATAKAPKAGPKPGRVSKASGKAKGAAKPAMATKAPAAEKPTSEPPKPVTHTVLTQAGPVTLPGKAPDSLPAAQS